MILEQINKVDLREVSLINFVNGQPNGLFVVLRHLLHDILDKDRELVNLGCYTGRDLDYLLPICTPIKKKIECVDSFSPVRLDIKEQLQTEIMSKYSNPLITWTWDKAENSEFIRSADFTFFSTPSEFPIEKYMTQTNHPACWASVSPVWLYPRLGSAFHFGQMHIVCVCMGYTIFTNDYEVKQKFLDCFDSINQKLNLIKQRLVKKDDICYLNTTDNSNTGMNHQWNFINNISL